MDPTPIAQQLAKQADTGTAAIILLLVVLCVVCWPHVVNGIARLRGRKTEIAPTPLPVEEQDKFMTRGECKRLMCAHDTQIAELRSDVKTGNINILHKLEAMDRKSEERAIAAHNRIEPLVQKLAKNIGQVELMKEAFIKSAIGGKK